MAAKHIATTNAMRALSKAGVSYTPIAYESKDGAIDGISVAHKLKQDENRVYKTLVTQDKSGSVHVFVVPVSRELDIKKAAKAAGAKSIEMLPLKQVLPTTGYIRGGCSPVGMKKQYPTYIDLSAQHWDTIYVSAGKIGVQMQVSPRDLAKLLDASFKELTQ